MNSQKNAISAAAIGAVTLFAAGVSASPAFAAQISCGQPTVSQQQQNGSMYTVTLSRSCRVSGAAGRYQALQAAMVNDIVNQAAATGGQVLAGPQSTTFNAGGVSLPAQYVRASIIRTTSGGDRMNVRQSIYVATDGRSVFITDSQSESVAGSGNSRYVRKVASRVKVTGVGGVYSVLISNQTSVEKPFFSPSDFSSRVQSSVAGELVKSSDRFLNSVVAPHF